MKDLGFFGTDNGFAAVVGAGWRTPKPGRELADGLTEEQAIALAKKVIAFYREFGVAPNAWCNHRARRFRQFVKAVI